LTTLDYKHYNFICLEDQGFPFNDSRTPRNSLMAFSSEESFNKYMDSLFFYLQYFQ
jgi:hypothetical protein